MTFRQLSADLKRSRELLVPPAFAFLWETPRYLVAYGGRASAKSWSIARVLLALAHERKLRVLCCREIQSSVRESAYRLLADQVRILQLEDDFDIRADSIAGRNGSEFIFEGLRYNISRLRSLEGVDLVWVEEGQSVSERSWEDFIPTIRKAGSRFFISYNPMTPDDPVAKRFVESGRKNVIARKVSWRDNPYLSPEVEAERVWLERTDPDAYRHVWEGEPRTVSDALILKGKYAVAPVEVSPDWAGPYHGLDYGFSRDPSAAVRCYVDDSARVLYIDREYWALGADIDKLPAALEASISGVSRHVVYADSARPESTSYLVRNGIPNARSAEKWPGSVDDGIAYLRSFARIVIDPRCRHLIDECGRYSFKCDRLTGVPLPEPIDAHNHLIDALRYALSPLIRKVPLGGYFSRAALLTSAPVDVPREVERVFAVGAITDAAPDELATSYLAVASGATVVTILDWDIRALEQATLDDYFPMVDARLKELVKLTGARSPHASLLVDPGGLGATLLAQGELRRHAAVAPVVDEQLLGKDLVARAVELGNYLQAGAVKFSHLAHEKRTTLKGIHRNHLVGELSGFTLGDKKVVGPLLAALATGALDALSGRQRLNTWLRLLNPTAGEPGPLAAVLTPPPPRPAAPAPEPPTDPEVARVMAPFIHEGCDFAAIRQRAERVVQQRRATEAALEAEHAKMREQMRIKEVAR